MLGHIDLVDLISNDVPLHKVTNGGEYAGPCPWCGGTDRFRVWKKERKTGKGQYWCRKCGVKGDVLDYLQARRNLTYPQALEALGLSSYSTSNGKARSTGGPVASTKSSKITRVYTYRDEHGVPVYEIVRTEPKAYKPRQLNGKWGYEGVRRVLYNLPEVLQAIQRNEPVYFVEGEKTAEAVKGLGVVATTIPGGAHGKWFPQYTEALHGAHIVILRDQDDAGHQHGERVACELNGTAASIKVIDLPGLTYRGSHGDDPEDWLNRGGARDDLLAIVSASSLPPAPEPASSTGIVLLRPDELFAQPPLEYLVSGFIPRGGFCVLFGPPGVGKSFAALDWALQVAQRECAVYMPYEGMSGYGPRINAWMQHYGCGYGDLFIAATPISLMDERQVEQLIEKLKPLKPGVVQVDTLARAMLDGDENSAKDMGRLIEACNRLQRETGTAVLVVHHANKSGGERGSSALRGAADVMIEMTKDNDLITMQCAKSKDAAPFIPRHYRLQEVEVEDGPSSCVLVPADHTETALEQRFGRHAAAVLMTAASEAARENGISAGELTSRAEVPEGSIYRILNKLKSEQLIHQPGGHGPYFITEEGLLLTTGKSGNIH